MKKSIFLITATLLFAVLLAACSDAGSDTSLYGPDGTPGTSDDVNTGLETPGFDVTSPISPTAVLTDPVETLPEATVEVTQDVGTSTVESTQTGGSVEGGLMADKLDAGRLSHLMDFEVHTPDHEVVGEIEDVILNLDGTRVDYIIVGVGGFIGIGEKEVAVPCELFDFNTQAALTTTNDTTTDDYYIILDIDKTALDAAPDWDPALLPDLGQPTGDWDVDLRGYWIDYDVSLDTTGTVDTTQPMESKLQGVVLASDAIGFNIENAAGEDIAEVDDIVIDTETCEILYVVVSYDDEVEGSVLVPVPPNALTIDPDAQVIVFADADNVIVDAPRYTVDKFPYTLDLDWDTDIRTFWETRIDTAP